MTHEISVVICAYTEKRWQALVAAVASAQHQTLSAREIIVVIDHNPALLRRAEEQLSDVTILENAGAKGLSGARNSGWTSARGEIIAFLDDDAIAEPDWLAQLAACYADPLVAGVGGKIIPLWEHQTPFWFPEEFNWVIGCTYRGMPVNQARIRNVIGANMSIRKAILEAMGGFRESFGCDKTSESSRHLLKWLNHYAGDEETEFCIRVSQRMPDSTWLYAAAAVVHHRVSIERTYWSYFLWRCYDEGLGKASLVRLHSVTVALSSEKAYATQTLSRGIACSLLDTFVQRDATSACRAGAMLVGLATAAVGYMVGSASSCLAKPAAPAQAMGV